ncbi:protein of unknown function [Nitrospira japonica]|uniref:Uncharacterized protein n=1 Tax=Nitrospira japonica TaxID=1325564 RepID=A0A1W1I1K5_9BACT|nr:hypothetical protein [Nitrospira japonica]SLM46896.1 protein of unknown function [Nitrospira japonica]
MRNVLGLKNHALACEGCKLSQNSLGVAGGIWRSINREFLTARRKAHAEVIFDQLEVSVMVTEQDSGIGAFSQLKFFHTMD